MSKPKPKVRTPIYFEALLPEHTKPVLIIDTKRFEMNPVILWKHDWIEWPVGIASNMKKAERSIIFSPGFHYQSYLAKWCNAVLTHAPILFQFGCGGTFKGQTFELAEISVLEPDLPAGEPESTLAGKTIQLLQNFKTLQNDRVE
jgi:hypothetical protein